MNIPPEVIAAIDNSLEKAKLPKTVRTRPCRIKFNGEFITTTSKKTVWRNKGFAKAAGIELSDFYAKFEAARGSMKIGSL